MSKSSRVIPLWELVEVGLRLGTWDYNAKGTVLVLGLSEFTVQMVKYRRSNCASGKKKVGFKPDYAEPK